MKTILIIVAAWLALFGTWCYRQTLRESTRSADVPAVPAVRIERDFLVNDPWSVSNAVKFQAPPEGWEIVCDDHGNYAVRHGGIVRGWNISSSALKYVRTSRFDAITVTWRINGIIQETSPTSVIDDFFTNVWRECEDTK